jgi:hypothetical protein
MPIVTGYEYDAMRSVAGKEILFANDGVDDRYYSRPVLIPQNTASFFTAYGWPQSTDYITTQYIRNNAQGQLGWLVPKLGDEPWQLDPDHSIMIIALPGLYRFLLNPEFVFDPDQTDFVVEYFQMSLDQIPPLKGFMVR